MNTSFVERLKLTIEQCFSKRNARSTSGPAKFTPERMDHLEWWHRQRSWRAMIILSDFIESLEEKLTNPIHRKGKP